MTTRAVDCGVQYCDFMVGRLGRRDLPPGAANFAHFSPPYMKHGGNDDWREVQRWRYFEHLIRRLCADADLRADARRMKGATLGSWGEHGRDLAGILADVLDNSGILESEDDDWRAGFLQGVLDRPLEKPASKMRVARLLEGFNDGKRYALRRSALCGVHDGYEDPGDTDDQLRA